MVKRTEKPKATRAASSRTFRRSKERGSVIFIVIMAMMLLTALGTWVTYAAGVASNTSGYQRAASQSLYLSELSVLTGSSYAAQPGKGYEIYSLAVDARDDPTKTPDTCASVPPGVDTKLCKAVALSDINDEIITNGNASGFNLVDVSPGGSFGPYMDGLEGDFMVEFSGFTTTETRGTDLNATAKPYRRVTISAFATVRPGSGGADVCAGAAGVNASATTVKMRAFAVMGPVE